MSSSSYAIVDLETARRVSISTGVILGGLWAWQAGESVWAHAIRFGILLFIVAPIGLRVLARRQPAGMRIDGVRLVAAKGILLVAALAVSQLLGRVTAGADYYVAAGLAVVVALAGPPLAPFFVAPARAEADGRRG